MFALYMSYGRHSVVVGDGVFLLFSLHIHTLCDVVCGHFVFVVVVVRSSFTADKHHSETGHWRITKFSNYIDD